MKKESLKKISNLKKRISSSKDIVFFGGAGVSTESGIPDFRGEKGIYNTMKKYGESPETILSHEYFFSNTSLFYEYYKENIIYKYAQPNYYHIGINKLEKEGKIKAIITQNIDGLHQKAGSKNVLELHGNILKNYCVNCNAKYNLNYIIDSKDVPICRYCREIIKPDIVLYQEPLKEEIINKAIEFIIKADLLIIGGTSLVVYPAAGLVQHFKGKNLVLINKTMTSYDNYANLVINEPIGEVFKKII